MAWHVRGVVLPDDEVRDLWFVGDRVTLEPVPDAVTLSDGGFVLPGLVDAHCHLGIGPGAGGGSGVWWVSRGAGLRRLRCVSVGLATCGSARIFVLRSFAFCALR